MSSPEREDRVSGSCELAERLCRASAPAVASVRRILRRALLRKVGGRSDPARQRAMRQPEVRRSVLSSPGTGSWVTSVYAGHSAGRNAWYSNVSRPATGWS